MTKLKRITFINYCGFRNTTFDFTNPDGSINPIAVFFGPNGTGKSNALFGARACGNPHQYLGRDTDLAFRQITFHPDYDPVYQNIMEKVISDDYKMRMEAVFDVDGQEKRVVITTDGIMTNELEKKPSGHTHFIDADHPMNMQKFQLHDDALADVFLEIAEVVYGYKCELDKKITDMGSGEQFYTDFIIHKYGTKVHFKRFSAGEKKIATLLAGLCNPIHINHLNIVLVDNIEMHIYFKRHAKLIDKLLEKFPNHQFIVTTHSLALIQHVEQKYGKKALFDIEEYKANDVPLPADKIIWRIEKDGTWKGEDFSAPKTEEKSPTGNETQKVLWEEIKKITPKSIVTVDDLTPAHMTNTFKVIEGTDRVVTDLVCSPAMLAKLRAVKGVFSESSTSDCIKKNIFGYVWTASVRTFKSMPDDEIRLLHRGSKGDFAVVMKIDPEFAENEDEDTEEETEAVQ